MSRRRWAIALGGTVALAMAALVVATRVQSHDQAVADARPPERTVLTEVVERRVLEEHTVVRGTVGAAHEVPVPGPTPAGRDAIVTAPLPAVGAEVGEGAVVAEVAGRPVLLLVGDVPSYRDLGPGDSGADVAQLESALARLGRQVGARDGVYDDALAAAVAGTWGAAGYAPATHDLGPGVPKGEVAFVPALPARVLRTAGAVGTPVAGEPVVVLAAGPLRVRAWADAPDAPAFAVGGAVDVLAEAHQERFAGTVVGVGPTTVDEETGRLRAQLDVEVDAITPALLGQEVRVTARAAGAEPGLVVPLAAVFATAGGDDAVLVLDRDGTERRVPVVAGASADGFVLVEPVEPGALDPGDHVVVGR